jgi:hypothetical protein
VVVGPHPHEFDARASIAHPTTRFILTTRDECKADRGRVGWSAELERFMAAAWA